MPPSRWDTIVGGLAEPGDSRGARIGGPQTVTEAAVDVGAVPIRGEDGCRRPTDRAGNARIVFVDKLVVTVCTVGLKLMVLRDENAAAEDRLMSGTALSP